MPDRTAAKCGVAAVTCSHRKISDHSNNHDEPAGAERPGFSAALCNPPKIREEWLFAVESGDDCAIKESSGGAQPGTELFVSAATMADGVSESDLAG